MDLAELDAPDARADMEVRHPATNEPLLTADKQPVTISLLGVDSDVFRAGERKLANRRLKQGQKAKVTAEGVEAQAIGLLADCTVGWSGIEFEGAVLSFTRENAVMLYTRLRWLREQVDEFIGDRANFLKASAKN